MPKHIRKTNRHRWTDAEDNKLREMMARHAPTAEYEQVFYFLVPSAIYARKRKLGLISSRTKWSQREDEIVKNNFFNQNADWRVLLPNRTFAAIKLRAKHLGLAAQKTKGSRWSTDEDDYVRNNYGVHGKDWDGWAKMPHRTWSSVQSRASKLGVPRLSARMTKAERTELVRGILNASLIIKRSPQECMMETAYLYKMGLWEKYWGL